MNWQRLNRGYLGLRARRPELKRFIRQRADLDKDLYHSELLAVDLEMTGLEPGRHEIISFGWVPISRGQIILGEARRLLVKPKHGVGDSATIHGIHDHHLEDAMALPDALDQFWQALAGRVFVAHHGAFDIAFLNQACQQLYGHKLPFDLLDTLRVEAKRLHRQGEHYDKQLLRLYACCERYELPPMGAHDALSDAIVTAQLLLAQHAAIAGGESLSVAEMIAYGH